MTAASGSSPVPRSLVRPAELELLADLYRSGALDGLDVFSAGCYGYRMPSLLIYATRDEYADAVLRLRLEEAGEHLPANGRVHRLTVLHHPDGAVEMVFVEPAAVE